MMKLIKLIFGLMVLLLLQSCWYGGGLNNTPQHFTILPVQQRQLKLTQLTRWQLDGSFSVQQAGQLPVIASYEWQQFNPTRYQIDINAPLNLMHVVIAGQPGVVRLQNSQGQSSEAGSAELLMQQVLGWSLPISDLWYWVRGLPANAPSAGLYFDHFGHMVRLQQDGWIVRFVQYQTVARGIDLPQQIELERPGIAAKIMAKNWVLYGQ